MTTTFDVRLPVERTAALDESRILRPTGPQALPTVSGAALLKEIETAGLTGRGGAAFPTHRKMAGVVGGPAPRIVVGNGSEGEPASNKDKTLLTTNPHLVLDGLQAAATIVGADRAFLYLHDDARVLAAVDRALAERRAAGVDQWTVHVVTAPPRFVSGEESAVVARISGSEALPRSKPPRVFERGAFGRPTLVQNVETLAHIGYIARFGAAQFRSVGAAEQPGTMLFTVSGAVRRPGVIEAPVGVGLDAVIAAAGGPSTAVQAVLLGGYHGSWVRWADAQSLVMANAALRPHGLSVGAGVVVLLPADECGPHEVSRVLDYLAGESAGQCGPCVFGLPAVADAYHDLVAGKSSRSRLKRLDELPALLERRGGCAHPDGTLRFLRSAQSVFGEHLAQHQRRACAQRRAGVLPIPTD